MAPASASPKRRICVTSRDEEPLRLESLEDETYLVPHRCRCWISEKDKPTVELELYYADGALRIRSVAVSHDEGARELRAADLRFPLSTYLRLAVLTVAYRREPVDYDERVVRFLPVAPYGGTCYFLLHGTDITPLHMGDWDDEATTKADEAMRQPRRVARRPYGRLDETQRKALLTRIANIYLDAARASQPPIKTIMREEYVSRPTAARWVALARDRGLLPAANGTHGWRRLQSAEDETNATGT